MKTVRENSKLSKKILRQLEEAFASFDKDNSGTICAHELRSVLKLLNQPCSAEDVQVVMNTLEKGNDDTLNFVEFVRLLEPQLLLEKSRRHDEKIREAFKNFDKNNDGVITIVELQAVIRNLIPEITNHEVGLMLNEIDKDKNGSVTLKEFEDLFKRI